MLFGIYRLWQIFCERMLRMNQNAVCLFFPGMDIIGIVITTTATANIIYCCSQEQQHLWQCCFSALFFFDDLCTTVLSLMKYFAWTGGALYPQALSKDFNCVAIIMWQRKIRTQTQVFKHYCHQWTFCLLCSVKFEWCVREFFCKKILAGFLQVRENWKKSENLYGQGKLGKGQGKILFLKSQGKWSWIMQTADFCDFLCLQILSSRQIYRFLW